MGGTCVRNNGKWELGTTNIDLSPIGQVVLNTDRKSIMGARFLLYTLRTSLSDQIIILTDLIPRLTDCLLRV